MKSFVNFRNVAAAALVLGLIHTQNAHAFDLMETAKDAGFMEWVLLLTSIAGFALGLQAFVSMRAHVLRPPELAVELQNLVQEGQIEEAMNAAQSDGSFFGTVAYATLAAHQFGKEGMEQAMADTGEVESNKILNRIGLLNLIAAIAPMLGLTGTSLGMIITFDTIATKSDAVTAADMAKGISVALICTFTGLMVAIPLLVLGFFLKSIVTQVILEVSSDCNQFITVVTGGEQQEQA